MSEIKKLELLKQFPPVTTEQWEEVVKKDLKGADYAKRLLWRTDDGITVKPYYRSADLVRDGAVDSTPGDFPFTRGTTPKPGWNIREEIEEADPAKANELAHKALASGANEICFVIESGRDGLRGVHAHSAQDVSVLLSRIPLDQVPVHFRAKSNAKQVYEALVQGLGPRALHVMGSLDYDPLGDLALTGHAAVSRDGLFDEAADLVKSAWKRTPTLKVIAVRGYEFHESGGTTVQELGCALAEAVEYVSELEKRGVTPEQTSKSLFFALAAGCNYFFEVAKFRAARTLWAKTLTAFGVEPQNARAALHARTAEWNTTIYDAYVNVLRGTTGAMSAALGGADCIAVLPFDTCYKQSDDFSRRLARNTQIILKKEAYFDHVVDPAAGSYYVETLTESVAREAWTIMQQVEGCGGFLKALEDGWVQKGIELSRQAKDAAIAARRRNVLGTNQFPNQHERMLSSIERLNSGCNGTDVPAAIRVEPLKRRRGAEVFEALRLRMERHAANGHPTPRIVLLEIGDVKMRKARSAFSSNFFGCGGFDIAEVSASDMDSAFNEAVAASPDIIVLCSSDEEYPRVAGPIIRKLRDAGKSCPVIVAGHPKDSIEILQQDGVADFIHMKSNAVEVLRNWQDKMGVRD